MWHLPRSPNLGSWNSKGIDTNMKASSTGFAGGPMSTRIISTSSKNADCLWPLAWRRRVARHVNIPPPRLAGSRACKITVYMLCKYFLADQVRTVRLGTAYTAPSNILSEPGLFQSPPNASKIRPQTLPKASPSSCLNFQRCVLPFGSQNGLKCV